MSPPTITLLASGSMLAKSTVHGASEPDRKHIISYTAGGTDGAALLSCTSGVSERLQQTLHSCIFHTYQHTFMKSGQEELIRW